MIRPLALPLLALLLGGTAHAQYYYDPGRAQPQDRQLPGYSDDETWSGGSSVRSDDMRPGYAPPAPPPPPGTNGGYRNDGSYAGYGQGYAPDEGQPGGYDDRGYGYEAPPPPPAAPRSTRPAARSPYADRIARWRARADACEAGDQRACEGPE